MTEVMFHFNVPDKVGYACRVLRKARAGGNTVGVVADDQTLEQLDESLWTFSAPDFIAHCKVSAPEPVLSHTPILLAGTCAALPDAAVLLHLGRDVPQGFERFARLIELVSTDTADRNHARQRWRHYADRGYAIRRHDVTAKE